jgi:hypothetical protein
MATVRHLGLFPWCVPTVEENLAYSFWPGPVELATALKWYWRVKKWRFIGEATDGSVTVSQNQIITNNASYELGEFSVEQPTTEKGLVCDYGTRAIYNDGQDDEFGLYLYDEIADPRAIRYNDETYPSVIAFIWVDGILFSTASIPNAAAFGLATIDGTAFNLTTGDETVTPGFSASITITPEEYWPYDPGDGLGPIYDSATGAQLRPLPA